MDVSFAFLVDKYSLDDRGVYSYTISMRGQNDEDGSITSREIEYILTCEPKYNPYTLIWLNKLGGYDSFDFTKVNKRSFEFEKKSYNQLPYTILTDNYTHPYANGQMTYFNNRSLNENKIVYNSTYSEKLTLNTDIIDEATYKWLFELVISPKIFLYENGMLIPIYIKDTNYELKTRVNDKVFNLTLNLEYSDNINTQYR
mgnify:CR=1 FL=1